MIAKRSLSRPCAVGLLLLTGVLVLGIVQWSFLPVLIQNGPSIGTTVLEISVSHTSKFAAPYEALFGDGLNPCLVQSGIALRQVASRIVSLPEEPISRQNDSSLTHRPLRAPPSA